MINDYTGKELLFSLYDGLDSCSETLLVIRESLSILDEEGAYLESDKSRFAVAVLNKFTSDLDDRLKVLTAKAHLILEDMDED